MFFSNNTSELRSSSATFKTDSQKVNLPIPQKFKAKGTFGSVNSAFSTIYKPLEEDERRWIESFIEPIMLMWKSNLISLTSEPINKMNFNPIIERQINKLCSSLTPRSLPCETLEQTIDWQTETVQNNNIKFDLNKLALNELWDNDSVVDNGLQNKVPTKESLYELSSMIQNTNPEFQNFLSNDISACVDCCRLTQDSLFVSKKISGFDWSFEIFFEKAKETNRNRRLLKCKHQECNKVFKKAWNLFDHMRIHTGEKPFFCTDWGKAFAQNGNLTKHMKLHIKKDRKIHDCKIWGKKYTEKFNLRVHMKKHKLGSNATDE